MSLGYIDLTYANAAIILLLALAIFEVLTSEFRTASLARRTLVVAHFLATCGVVLIGAQIQLQASENDKRIERAKLEMTVLMDINERHIPVIENLMEIQSNLIGLKSYLDHERMMEQLLKESPKLAEYITWENTYDEEIKTQFFRAKTAFDNLQRHAIDII